MDKIYLVLEWCGDSNDVVAAFDSWVNAKKFCMLKNEICSIGLHYSLEECYCYSCEFIENIKNDNFFKDIVNEDS